MVTGGSEAAVTIAGMGGFHACIVNKKWWSNNCF
jgi:hypothetical protein